MASPRRTIGQDYPGSSYDEVWRGLICPPGYRNPSPKSRYHLVVIGAGPAGLVTSIAAAGLGAKVALVEKRAMGGDCLNVGCIPSKALLEFTARHRGPECFDAAFSWLREVRAKVSPADSIDRYRDAGVDVFFGAARFADESTVAVGDIELSSRRTLVATGARAALPSIPGLPEAKPLTNETLFELRSRPSRLAIVGGGPMGCEMAQAFSRMGVDTHLIEIAPRILPSEPPAASDAVAAALRRDGVSLYLGTGVTGILRRGSSVLLSTTGAPITASEVLVAAGRRANTDELNLAAVGVAAHADGLIQVDKYLRTSNPKIYAAGDVCSRLPYAHNADAQARIVVQNALFFASATVNEGVIPHCTYTNPEVARVGASRQELESRGVPFDAHRIDFGELDRGQAQGDEDGFAEILTKRGEPAILGATIVGRDAGEQIAALCVAMANGLGLDAFAKTILPYPTRSEYLRRIGDAHNRKRLTSAARSMIRSWLRLRA